MSNRVADETARQFVHEWQSPRPRDTGADSLTAYYACADLLDSRAECERLRGELAEAVEALRPFAMEAQQWRLDTDDEERPRVRAKTDLETYVAAYTVGDLRRAARVVDGAE